jgi:hypothetical protein
MTAPGLGAADTARIYAVADAGALTDLAAVFQDGTVDVFAQEVTPLDAPILQVPSRSRVEMEIRKPHPGLIQFVALLPDGGEFIMREIEHHGRAHVEATRGAETDEIPENWIW